MLKKSIYSCKYMDSWERFNEKSSPDKEDFYNYLNIEKITSTDYKHAKKVWKNFEMKNFGYYHELHVQCDSLLLIHVFESFCNRCIEINELDPVHFLSSTGLSWQAWYWYAINGIERN